MCDIELAQISAELSQKITEWDPLYDRVRKVVNENFYEMESTETPIFANTFWADDRDHAIVSPEQKARIFLRHHHSRTSFEKVLAFVIALQELCDSGVSLAHQGQPVVDLWVLNTHQFDVSDIISMGGLRAHYPQADMDTSIIRTHQTRDILDENLQTRKKQPATARKRRSRVVEDMREFQPKSYKESISHWWVAAIVEDPSQTGEPRQRQMVHIDMRCCI